MLIKKLLLLSLLLSICVRSFPQDGGEQTKNKLTITEKSAVEMAVNYNLSLKMSEIDVKILKNAQDTGWNNFIPSFSFSAGINRNGSAALPAQTQAKPQSEADKWAFTASVGASLNLSSASVSSLRKTAREYHTSLITYEDAVKKLEADVKKMFYRLLVTAEDARISSGVLENAELKYKLDSQYYADGLVSEMQALRSEVQFQNAKSDLMLKYFNYQEQLSDFCDLLGIDRSSEVTLDGNIDPLFIQVDAESLVASHLYNRADIKKTRLELERLQDEQRDAWISLYTPALNASYSLNYGDILKLPSGSGFTDAASVSLSLKIPLDVLIPGTKERNKFFDRASQIEKQRLKILQTVNDAENAVYGMIRQLEKSERALGILRSAEQLAERSYKITYQAYQRGEIPYTDVTDSENDLETARQRVLSERYIYRSLLIDLEYALDVKFSAW